MAREAELAARRGSVIATINVVIATAHSGWRGDGGGTWVVYVANTATAVRSHEHCQGASQSATS